MKKFVFVILHYVTIDDTVKCVDSIYSKAEKSDFEIVIVDNNSPNKSGKLLEKKYKDIDKIHVIINNKNLGFSAGNNIGFKYAKYQLNADFIILLNNDTCLLTENFCLRIFEDYEKLNFAVLGPKILTKDKVCGPLLKQPYTKESLKNDLNKLKLKLIFRKYFNINLKKFWKKKQFEHEEYNERLEDIVLHGCFLIFSPIYIEKYDGLLEKTFFYGEEIILYNRCKKNNMKMFFNPKIEIFHNEFSATNAVVKTEKKREINRMKRLIDAYKIIVNDWDEI